MKILILPSEQFIPAHEPLAGTFQHDQARILINAGHDVSVISVGLKFSLPMIAKAMLYRMAGKKLPNATQEKTFTGLFILAWDKIQKPEKFITKEHINGINVYRAEGFYLTAPSVSTDHRYWVAAGLKAFEKYLEEHGKPDIVHAHNALYAGLLASAIKRKYNVPYILTEHSSYYSRKLYATVLLPEAEKVFCNAAVLTAVSPFLIECLREIFPSTLNWQVLPNVAAPLFEETSLISKKSSGSFRFLHIANLIPLKRQALLIECFHDAFPENEHVQLAFAGEGESLEDLNRLVISLRESNRISFLGRLTKMQVLEELNGTNVVCLPSAYETFGVSLLEALLQGVPVIASNCGGPGELVSKQNGLLVDVDDKTALTKALQDIQKNYVDYDQPEIRRRAILKFGSRAFLEKLDHFYSQLVN